MKSVGVKALKNNLSRYLDMVRAGEVILVTDRDDVIAELRMPTQPVINRASAWVAFVEEQARRGLIYPAKRKRSRLVRSHVSLGVDAMSVLDAIRDERI